MSDHMTSALPQLRERIVGVALMTDDGLVFTLPAPQRHHHVISAMNCAQVARETTLKATQGFITSRGRFVSRKTAYRIAFECEQILDGKRVNPEHGLFSEDLW